ncbi:MAG: hypothetical protein K0S99_948, partial [Thermomicrobiales bacterium]|nr:hypothetical protein [Thermomicrobiales bacterium]
MPSYTLINCLMLFFYLARPPRVKGSIQNLTPLG